MIEWVKELLFSKAAFLGALLGAIPAGLLAMKDPPETWQDMLVIALIVLNGAIGPRKLMEGPNGNKNGGTE